MVIMTKALLKILSYTGYVSLDETTVQPAFASGLEIGIPVSFLMKYGLRVKLYKVLLGVAFSLFSPFPCYFLPFLALSIKAIWASKHLYQSTLAIQACLFSMSLEQSRNFPWISICPSRTIPDKQTLHMQYFRTYHGDIMLALWQV